MSWQGFDDRRVDVPKMLRGLGIEAERDGDKLRARCPAHRDSKPSWSIIDAPAETRNGVHGCWSCGFSGRAVGLAKHVLGLATWTVAREWIEESAWRHEGHHGFEVRAVLDQSGARPELRLPAGVITAPLEAWPERPREYALSRGLTAAQIERWQIGYAVDGLMRGRIVVPTYAASGRLTSYTGRAYAGSALRYLSATTPDFSVPFGEALWPPLGARGRVAVAEGALNALAVERALFGPVAALSGSNVHPLVLQKLSTFREVLIVTDPDLAGEKVAAVLRSLAFHVRLLRVALPVGQDAASVPQDALLGAMLEAREV